MWNTTTTTTTTTTTPPPVATMATKSKMVISILKVTVIDLDVISKGFFNWLNMNAKC